MLFPVFKSTNIFFLPLLLNTANASVLYRRQVSNSSFPTSDVNGTVADRSSEPSFRYMFYPNSFYDPLCETSDASPFLNDTLTAISQIRSKDPQYCIHKDTFFAEEEFPIQSSGCTTLMIYESAALALCGGAHRAQLLCTDFADAAETLAKTCVNNSTGKIGGLIEGYNKKVYQNEEFRIVVFKKKGWYDIHHITDGCHGPDWWKNTSCREWMTAKMKQIFPPGTPAPKMPESATPKIEHMCC